jgi:hypothetical protein
VVEREFFQLAAGLIPVLLFGGVLVNRVSLPRHRERTQSFWQIAEMILVFALGLLALYAETRALNGAIFEGNRGDRLVVIFAILIAMVAIVLRVVTPPLIHWVQSPSHPPVRRFNAGLAVLLVGFLIWQGYEAVGYLNDAVRFGTANAVRQHRFKELAETNEDARRTLDAVHESTKRSNWLRFEIAILLAKDPPPLSRANRHRYIYLKLELMNERRLMRQEERELRYLRRHRRFLGWHSIPVRE